MRDNRCWCINLIIDTVFGVMFAQLISMLNTQLVCGSPLVSRMLNMLILNRVC